ncbi:hypothetical protein NEUTE1DRAFT_115489 [Neurospora tetrasperma FGSC 2508]|uniref:Uncharacterized protein n=1 Tax=Neurospora tetrasperma (strain FGSC 2508 / ATCC MYA-4615 / P0657) TaxID=510951 RepID=F8MZL8_NEUT8|nr:uncharacterized protein NEUTE1DRAFT_115489 [Neurospora tetrasperma FGSC 2508]EGO53708.1 hypothetical protein NEUTE1DRAFT_115489 [Neurospora tetrasperma FGSC 2508]EGZ76216.1 hypothetical protein NEUTE2DRAFT_133593 [Neurospora tetrasperma FGSC 2509]
MEGVPAPQVSHQTNGPVMDPPKTVNESPSKTAAAVENWWKAKDPLANPVPEDMLGLGMEALEKQREELVLELMQTFPGGDQPIADSTELKNFIEDLKSREAVQAHLSVPSDMIWSNLLRSNQKPLIFLNQVFLNPHLDSPTVIMSGIPTGNLAGGPAGAGLPGTAARDPGPGTDTMTGIVDNDSN